MASCLWKSNHFLGKCADRQCKRCQIKRECIHSSHHSQWNHSTLSPLHKRHSRTGAAAGKARADTTIAAARSGGVSQVLPPTETTENHWNHWTVSLSTSGTSQSHNKQQPCFHDTSKSGFAKWIISRDVRITTDWKIVFTFLPYGLLIWWKWPSKIKKKSAKLNHGNVTDVTLKNNNKT